MGAILIPMHIIAGKYKHHRLIAPKGEETRPTTNRLRESLFNICQNYIQDANFLDLFAGSGAMGLEALSRGAGAATFVDSHRNSIQAIRQNVKSLQVEDRSQIFQSDVFSMLERLKTHANRFDIIYADPPYSQGKEGRLFSQQLVELIDQSDLLTPAGYLFIEDSHSVEITLKDLQRLKLVSKRSTGRAALMQFGLGSIE